MMSAVLSCLWVLCTMFYTYFPERRAQRQAENEKHYASADE